MDTSTTGRGRRRTCIVSCLGLLALMLAISPADADEQNAEALVQQARDLEIQERAYEQALSLYEKALADPVISDGLRGTALVGAARCCDALGRQENMRAHVEAALAIEGLAGNDHRDAVRLQQEIEKHDAKRTIEDEADRRTKALLAEQAKKRIRQAQVHLDTAWAAFNARRYDEAREELFRASTQLGGETPETKELFDALERVQPDRRELLRNLIEFFQTAQIRHYQQLRSVVEELYQAAKTQVGKQSYLGAAKLIEDAILRIDRSGFLGSPVGGSGALREDRDKLVLWLREIREKATALGVEVPPEPELPTVRSGTSDFTRQFYDLLAGAFGSQGDGQYPLRFYEMIGGVGGDSSPWVTSSPFQGNLHVSHAKGTLSRAQWTERWIRSNIPGKWDAQRGVVGRPGGRRSSPNTLVRFGDVVCVQHRESVHRQIEALRTWFSDKPAPMVADVFVLATDAAGIVQASQTLAAHASHRESGHDLVIKNRLARECLEVLRQLDGRPMEFLGSAELHFGDEASATLEVTALTEQHPLFQNVTPPKLSVTKDDARYGLSLEIYVEPLPNVGAPPARSAVSMAASVRIPRGSVNVPKPNAGLPFSRVAQISEQRVESNRELPTFGSLMLVGLENPFPSTDRGHDQLVVLIGLRAEGERTPDPPPGRTNPIVAPDTRLVERSIGALAAEVEDHLVQEDWPTQRAASEGQSLTTLREERNHTLEFLIARGAALIEPSQPSGELPISVNGHTVSGHLSPEEVARLDAYLAVLTRHAADLYEVDMVSVVASKERFVAWAQSEGATPLRDGWVLLNAVANQTIDPPMRNDTAQGTLFATARGKNARATQRVGFQRLAVETIVRDQHVRRVGTNGARYAAINGNIEEGLIVEVRPGLEQADGFRMVSVRARADRIKGVERRDYPGSDGDVFLEIPSWHGLQDQSGVYPMRDGDALLIALPHPGSSDRVIAVKVTVSKVR